MNRFIKLVNFEINRFIKLYIGLLVLTAISQFVSIFIAKSDYLNRAEQAKYASSSKALEEFISVNGTISFHHVTNNIFFVAPIAICVALMLLYIFMIWYRDYFGKNTFIYRLFMVPTSRMTIYFAKASTILIMVLSLIAYQFILLPIEITIFENSVPSELLSKVSTVDLILNNMLFTTVLPSNFIQFLLSYGVGLVSIFAIFTVILLERSFRWKGILMGILYAAFIVIVLISPILINELVLMPNNGFSLYPNEVFYIELGLIGLITAISIMLSKYLLQNKVSV
ncbi:hypothetical protein [Gottfriedia solisilvae]|uniref:Uncharacterized protein n=1 Tax=Gottfriedia solisilvae TaxID=1516104 RepID=A0A8J3EYQ5_9BACI|nr:hypothetical protein [Gottfriedia solisilvae]GGI16235.1 hypothetical protein GCM10007380_31950 [Gottfriedia solisilvae]